MHDLEGRFTNLAFALAASRIFAAPTEMMPGAAGSPLAGLARFAAVWLTFVALGFWL